MAAFVFVQQTEKHYLKNDACVHVVCFRLTVPILAQPANSVCPVSFCLQRKKRHNYRCRDIKYKVLLGLSVAYHCKWHGITYSTLTNRVI